MRDVRLLTSAIVTILSGTILYASLQKLNTHPSGEVVVATLVKDETIYQLESDHKCSGQIRVRPDQNSISIDGAIETAEAGRVELNFALVFNELMQLSRGLGQVKVGGEVVLRLNLQGVTPLVTNLEIKGGFSLPSLPPLPLILLRRAYRGKLELILTGLGAVDYLQTESLSPLKKIQERVNFKELKAGQPNCGFNPLQLSSLRQ